MRPRSLSSRRHHPRRRRGRRPRHRRRRLPLVYSHSLSPKASFLVLHEMPVLAERPPSSNATPTPRQPSANSARPRPLSMPMAPQQYAPVPGVPQAADGATPRAEGPSSTSATPNGRQKPRSSNRVLGDYTLGKTLGAGSMGKVKLAYHNITGEKVCCHYP